MQKQRSLDKQATKGRLYPVPAPIGNLEDMSVCCLNILKEVTVIASEDIRNTRKLLDHFEITTPQISLHEHNYKERIPQLITRLLNDRTIAQVGDAGMPLISDPGHELVTACLEGELAVITLSGPTVGTTTLTASGLLSQPFAFYGFLPRKRKEQKDVLSALKEERPTQILYESPYRTAKTVATSAETYGQERLAVICRELTKLHEGYLRGTLGELAEYLAENTLKDECCLLVSGSTGEKGTIAAVPAISLKEHVQVLMREEGRNSEEAIKEAAKLRNVKRQGVYKGYHSI